MEVGGFQDSINFSFSGEEESWGGDVFMLKD